MTTLVTVILCATTAGSFDCLDEKYDRTAQYQWEMTVEQCHGMPFQSMMAQELPKNFPGYRIRKWKCEPMATEKFEFK